jgi:hypothetical protein
MKQTTTYLTHSVEATSRGAEPPGKGMRQRVREGLKGAGHLAAIMALIIGAMLGSGLPASASIDPCQPTYAPSININDVVHVERGSGQLFGWIAGFTVQLSCSSSQTVKVKYHTADGTATGPKDGATGDYTAIPDTPLTFNPGETKNFIWVAVNDDILNEPNETFKVQLSSPQNAWIGKGTGTCLILDDDPGKLTIFDVSGSAYEGSSFPFKFKVILSRPYSQTVKVNYATANDTAVYPKDYTFTSDTLSFSPGDPTTKYVNVNVVLPTDNDCLTKKFKVILSNPTFTGHGVTVAPIADNTGIGAIEHFCIK